MKDFKELAILAAKDAGRMLRDNFGKTQEVEYKGIVNIVTEVDFQSEDRIISLIKGEYPDHSILTEESKGHETPSDYKWIIDPLDGTTNYAHGYPFVCVSIALEVNGDVVLGVVYDPLRDELFTAEKGNGAYLNGNRIRVSETDELIRSLLSTGFAYNIRETAENNLNHYCNFALRVQGIRRDGAAALDLCYTAIGKFDGFWELYLAPWDMAAGSLIVSEAGGKVTNFTGEGFSIYFKEIVASNGRIHNDMIKILQMGKREEMKRGRLPQL